MNTRSLADEEQGSEASPGSVETPCIADRYEIIGLVGMGGMGIVYRVRDRELDEVVALKFLRRDAGADEKLLARFRDEAKLARRVSHVNVARTFDIGEYKGEKFLTMEFVDGEPLSRVLEREGSLSLARAAEILRQICAGLTAAHAAGVVHRDLKPDNILLEPRGRVVISDFGIARSEGPRASTTSDGGILGTAAYMSPEQAQGHVADARSDIYALGTMLYEMLTGARAWAGDGFIQVAARRVLEAPPDPRGRRPDLPAPVADVVLRAMAREKDARFATASDVATAFDRALASHESATAIVAVMPRVDVAARAFRVAPVPQEDGTTIAVIPFVNQGPRDDDFIADELTDDLIDSLSMVRSLRVRPRRLVERHEPRELAAFGRAVDAHVAIEGKIRRTNDTIRLSVRVMALAEELQIWAGRFERPASDVIGASREMARAVGEALTSGIAPRASTARTAVSTRPPDAMASEIYLRARRELRRAWAGTGDLELAVELFRQAVARAPDDAAVLSGFAMARARHYNYRGGGEDEVAAIRALAERAIALAPHMGEPWQTLATLAFVTNAWPETVRAFRRALHLAPGLLRAHETLAHVEVEVGRIEEGLFRLRTVMSLDPTNTLARWEAVRAHAMRNEWHRADELLSLPVEEGPEAYMHRMTSTRIDLYRGGPPRVPLVTIEEAGQERALKTARLFGLVARGQATPTDFEAVQLILAQAPLRSRLRAVMLQMLTEAHAARGEHELALASVRDAVAAHLYDRAWLDHCPLLASLRSDPSWPRIVADVEARNRPVIEALDESLPA